MQFEAEALSRALFKAGSNMPARTAIMLITTSNSMSVNLFE
jgi:hypothetical protein